MFQEAKRMAGLTSAIFSQMEVLQKQAVANGADLIRLGVGSPDMAPAAHIVHAMRDAIECGDNYGYTLSKGRMDFLQAIAQWYQTKFDVTLDPEKEIHSLIGSQDGLAHIGLCMVNPGDVVLVPDPGYPIFSNGPLVAEAELYKMCLSPENGYLPDLTAIPSGILERAKLMILNYPNNPLAATATPEFFQQVVDLAHKYKFLVCHDFAYSELVFDGYRPPSFLSTPGAREIGIEFNSLSKTYNMCGCRVGFIVGNSQAIAMLGKLKSNFDYGIFAPLQKAGIAALLGPQDCVRDTAAAYQRRRDILVDGFAKIGWQVERPKASMYLWAKVPNGKKSFQFTEDLLFKTGITVIPGVAFGDCGEGYIRIALVETEERLHEAVRRVQNWLG